MVSTKRDLVLTMGGADILSPSGINILLKTEYYTEDSSRVYVELLSRGLGIEALLPNPGLYGVILGVRGTAGEDGIYGVIKAFQQQQTYVDLNNILYTSLTMGGVGLMGVSETSPDLIGVITSTPEDIRVASLGGFIVPILPLQSGHTTSGSAIYTSLLNGGLGIEGMSLTPDLVGVIMPTSKIFHDIRTLQGYITPIRPGSGTLGGYIRPSHSGSLSLSGTVSGCYARDIMGFIRPTINSSLSISGFIEPIPPLPLYGNLYGYTFNNLPGEIEPIPPQPISGSISGVLYKDLSGTVSGSYEESISGSYESYTVKDLHGHISGRGYTDLYGSIKGFLEIGAQELLGGYIRQGFHGESGISGSVFGVIYKDLLGAIDGRLSGIDIGGQISGILFEGALIGIVSPTGSLLMMPGYIFPVKPGSNLDISGTIDGTDQLDLSGTYTPDLNHRIYGQIVGSGTDLSGLGGTLEAFQEATISGNIVSNQDHLLLGTVEPIPAQDLYGIINPRVYYIDSSIPINTYLVQDLMAVVNSNECLPKSEFATLSGYISGINYAELYGNIISIAGQYAIAKDFISTTFSNVVMLEDWALILLDQPALYENYIPIIITQLPFNDLRGTITAVPNKSTISGVITPVYIKSVPRDGVPIGKLVNTVTGEIRLLRLFFKGSVNNFYYSSIGHETYSADPEDKLVLIVESYTKDDLDSDSLLDIKKKVRQCEVNNLQDFQSIDDAIKFAINCAANQIHGDLFGSYTPVGGLLDISASVSGIDSFVIKDLSGKVVAVTNDPAISGLIDPTGGLKDLVGYIVGSKPTNTAPIYTNLLGEHVVPRLVLHGSNQYSVVLTKVASSGTMDLSPTPDLSGYILGHVVDELSATISGL